MAAGLWPVLWQELSGLGRELAAEWAAQDVRAALCQLLLLWLGLSLLGIHLAWRNYGEVIAELCYRTRPDARRTPGPGTPSGAGPGRPRAHSLSPAGPAGRNGTAQRHCLPLDSSAAEPAKTHRE